MMNDPRSGGQATPRPAPGLCGDCVHAQLITSARGSTFYLCGLSATNPAFPKYPRLPVLICRGYTKGTKGTKDTKGTKGTKG